LEVKDISIFPKRGGIMAQRNNATAGAISLPDLQHLYMHINSAAIINIMATPKAILIPDNLPFAHILII
jgi:hypothetical protein